MIRTNTLFVLGAGASKPYGLPLGSELRTLICQAQNGGNPITNALVQDDHYTEADIRDVAVKFERSNVNSIDEFLSRHAHLVDVGKALIAAIILSKEDSGAVSSDETKDHWSRHLWNRLVDGATDGGSLKQNSVRFITFNYDRSLEYFLHVSTKGVFGSNDAAAFREWSRLPIMHVYGSVGQFRVEDGEDNIHKYGQAIDADRIYAASAGINIIPEGRDDAKEFREARDWFAWAQEVYILGFGFDRLNCERLGFSSVLEYKRTKGLPIPNISSSVLTLTPNEVTLARRRLLGDEWSWTTQNAPSTMTLRWTGLPD